MFCMLQCGQAWNVTGVRIWLANIERHSNHRQNLISLEQEVHADVPDTAVICHARAILLFSRSADNPGMSLAYEYGWRVLSTGPHASRTVRNQVGLWLRV
jgi:hypothetical protein